MPVSGKPEVVLDVSSITKTFGPTRALVNVDLTVRAGEVHALLGANGAGKSTLIKILAGVYSPDSGRIRIDGVDVHLTDPLQARSHGIAVIHQQLSVISSLTVAENFLIRSYAAKRSFARNRAEAAEQATTALASLGSQARATDMVSALTFGERQLLEIAIAISSNAKVVIMDEPTSGLTAKEQSSLFAAIRGLVASDVGIIYVSHKMNEVYEIADRITVLRNGHNAAEFPEAPWDRKQIVDSIVGESVAEVLRGDTDSIRVSDREPIVLEVKNLVTDRVSGVDLEIRQGEILGVYGVVGSGGPQLAEAIVGARRYTGSIRINGSPAPRTVLKARRSRVLFVPSDHRTRGAVAGQTIQENVLLGRGEWRRTAWRTVSTDLHTRVEAATDRLRVRRHSLAQPISQLSGGNQQKVVFARATLDAPKLLVLEDPTQGVDVGAKRDMLDEIERQREMGAAILMLSSEVSEFSSADRVLVLRDGMVVGELRRPNITEQQILELSAE